MIVSVILFAIPMFWRSLSVLSNESRKPIPELPAQAFLIHAVAYAPYRFDKFLVAVRILQFLAEPANVSHYCIIVFKVFLFPYGLKEFLR